MTGGQSGNSPFALQHQHSAVLITRVDLNPPLEHNAREFQHVRERRARPRRPPFRMEVKAGVTRRRGMFLQEDKGEGDEIK